MAPPRKKRRRLLWLALLLIVAVVGITVWLRRGRTPAAEPVTVEKAATRTIRQVVIATGKIQPEVEVKITAEVYGEIVELPFREGASVKKGDMIIKIKPDLYKAQVEQAKASVSVAQSAALHAKAALAKANSDLEQNEDLHAKGLVSKSDFIAFQTAAATAQADYVSAQASQQQAEGSLGQAQDALSKTIIRSPIDGTISLLNSEVGESVVAQSSFTGTEILRVADLGHMQVRVNVNENDVPNVKLGDPVSIAVDAYPDRKFNGEVTAIGSSAENLGGTGSGAQAQSQVTNSDEVTNFLVKIAIKDAGSALRPGMSATATIETKTVPDAIAVPIQAVTVRDNAGESADAMQKKKEKEAREQTGRDVSTKAEHVEAKRSRDLLQHVIFIKVGDKVRQQVVETGIADNNWIEVKSGVKAGDEVVSGSYAAVSKRLKDGSAVRIEQPPAAGAAAAAKN